MIEQKRLNPANLGVPGMKKILESHNTQAQIKLATAANVPFILLFIDTKNWYFRAYPLNSSAARLLTLYQVERSDYVDFNEQEWVEFLHYVRGEPARIEIISKLSNRRYANV